MKKISVVAMSVAILLLIGSCAQRNVKEATPKPTTSVTKVTETPKPTPTNAATPTTNPNAKPVPGSCLVLEERYCKTATFVTINGFLMAFYKLPVGTPIFSPYRGVITAGTPTDGVGGPEIPNMADITTVKTGGKVGCLCGTDTLEVLYTGSIDRKNLLAAGKLISVSGDGKSILARISKGEILGRTGQILARTGEMDLFSKLLNEYNLTMKFVIGDHNPDNAKTQAVFGISQQK